MSFQDVNGARQPFLGPDARPDGAAAAAAAAAGPSRALAAGVFKISTAVATFKRLVNTLGTPKDTPELREKIHKARQNIGQLVKETSAKLKDASEVDHQVPVPANKKLSDAKLAKDFQAILKEFQKAQRIAADRETIYQPFVPAREMTSSTGQDHMQQAQQQQVIEIDNELVFNEAIIEERDQGIREIQQQIGEVHEIFKDLAVLIHEQGGMIDDIEANIESGHALTMQANTQLSKAAKSQRSANSLVGNVFVNQYYNVLHQQPQNVHRFYTDASRVTRAEAGSDGAVDMVVNQNEIHRKIMSLDYAEFKAEIKTVDSQDSLTGGVLVMVTGSLTNKADGKRNFVQSFFLAPQEKGYYVLNDVFRYIDEEPQQVKHAVLLANGTPEPASSHTASEPEHVVHEVPATPELNEAIATHTYAASPDIGHTPPTEAAAVETVKDEEPVNQAAVDSVESLADNPLGDANDTTGSGYSSEEPKKFSYASILGLTHMRRKNDARGAPAPAAAAPAKPVQAATPIAASAVEAPAAPAPPIQPPATTASATPTQVSSAAPPPPPTDDISAEEAEADSRSVFVRYLPLNVTPTDVGEAFRNFGVVKLDRVNIKGQKQPNAQNCYGFVEFEDQAGALAAIEPSGVADEEVVEASACHIATTICAAGVRMEAVERAEVRATWATPAAWAPATAEGAASTVAVIRSTAAIRGREAMVIGGRPT
eukprot:SM000030S11333  [mRNA]  locus=s30:130796:137701:- [translate_table: standard]